MNNPLDKAIDWLGKGAFKPIEPTGTAHHHDKKADFHERKAREYEAKGSQGLADKHWAAHDTHSKIAKEKYKAMPPKGPLRGMRGTKPPAKTKVIKSMIDWIEKAKKSSKVYKMSAIHVKSEGEGHKKLSHFNVHARSKRHAEKKLADHLDAKGHDFQMAHGHISNDYHAHPARKMKVK